MPSRPTRPKVWSCQSPALSTLRHAHTETSSYTRWELGKEDDVMGERIIEPRATWAASRSLVRQVVARHPVATFLITCYAINWAVVVPALRIQGGLPFGLRLWESLGTIIGVALAAFLVVAATDGRVGVRDLASRCVRWRVGVRWYLIALLAMPIAIPLAATVIYGAAPLHNLASQ